MKKNLAILLCALLLCCLCTGAEDRATAQLLFQEAETAETDGDFAKAAALLEQAASAGMDGGRLHYNLGNLHARQKHFGLAIAHYLKAQDAMPGNLDLSNNLAYVRSLRLDNFEQPETRRIMKTLFFWHYDLPRHLRLHFVLWPLPFFWLAAAILLWKRPTWLKWSTAVLALWCAAFAVSVGIQDWNRAHSQTAVVIVEEVHPRKGDNLRYDNAFSAPVHDGTEVIVTRRRGGWSEIKLSNGLSGWLQDSDLMMI